jgi:hypothetical protein
MPETEARDDRRNEDARSRVPVIAMSGGGRIGPTDYRETARCVGVAATRAKPFARNEPISLVSNFLSEGES